MKKNIILGAGLSGLTYASKNPDYLILEKENEPGGLCRSRHKKNFIFDYSGHLLHTKNEKLKQYLHSLMDFSTHTRKASAYINTTKIPIPVQNNINYFPKRIKEKIIQTLPTKTIPAGCNTLFHLWCKQNFGNQLYNIFFKPYNQKFWGEYFHEINSSWVPGFITNPEKNTPIKKTIQNKGYNASFLYPKKNGMGELAKQIAKTNNLNISTNTTIKKIDLKKKTISTSTSKQYPYNNLISSIPLIELKDILTHVPDKIHDAFLQLKHTSVLNLNIGLNHTPLFDDHWIYFPNSQTSFYRIGCYTNFAPLNSPLNHSSYYIEKTLSLNENKETAAKEMIDDFIRIFKISKEDITIIDEVFIKYAYVVFDKNREQSLKEINCFLKDNNIQTIGRYGLWNYSSMNESLSI